MTWKLYEDDCLKILPTIPENSIDLIILDPPYNIGKDTWDKFPSHEEYLIFIRKVLVESERVLRDNGSLYIYHNQFKSLRDFDCLIEENTRLIHKSLITIKKTSNNYIKDRFSCQEHFRNYLNEAEYLLFYTFQDETGLTTIKLDRNNFTSLRQYFKDFQEALGMSLPEINRTLGHRRAEHWFYWKSTQWDLPTRETYEELLKLPLKNYDFIRKDYEELREEYEELRYTFNETKGKSNVWEYKFRVDKRTHPTQKPINMSEDIIKASSKPNDTILIPFAGSGSELIAATNLNRKAIGIEQNPTYCKTIRNRLKEETSQTKL